MRFLARRLFATIITLLVVTLVVFFLSRMGGDPRLVLLSDDATQEQWDSFGEAHGLDKPVVVQYWIYTKKIVRGDLGNSTLQRRPVREILWERIPNSFQLAMTAFAFSLIVGIPLGVLAATRRGGWWDYGVRAAAVFGDSMPAFWVGLMLMFVFAVQLEWVPVARKDGWESFILPTVVLGWGAAAGQIRLLRSSLLEVFGSEYITLARAKGVSERKIVWKHAMRNALIAPITAAGLTLAGVITGAIIVETIFSWPGLGGLAIEAVNNSDYAVLQGVMILITVMYVMANLVVDLLYVMIDPRIRLG
jgi:peptide/nickel transport system permease protein